MRGSIRRLRTAPALCQVTIEPRADCGILTLSVERVPTGGAAEWDGFVRGQAAWTPYQLYGWRGVMDQVHGHECLYLGARGAEGRLRGVLPLVRVRSRVFGHFLVSMPFINYGGPLGDEEALGSLVREAVRIADEGPVDLLELRNSHEAAVGLPASHRKITVLLDLPPGQPEALWRGLPSKVRSQIKRPMKEGAEVRFGPGEIGPFYEVFARHMRDLGTPVQPRRFFERAHDSFPESMWFGCVYLASRPAAVGCGFRWGERFELVWASSLREYSAAAPNMLLYWRFLERCAADGAAVFDFGRCTPGGGTHRFKAQWGGRDVPLWWYQHGPSAGGGTPSPDSGPYSLGPKIWSRLPLALANALGPRIVRFIP